MSEQYSERLRNFMTSHLFEKDDTGYSCTGNARVIIEKVLSEFGISGRIMEIAQGEDISHSLVILGIQKEIELALNQQVGHDLLTVGVVKRRGKDITAEILNTPWEQL